MTTFTLIYALIGTAILYYLCPMRFRWILLLGMSFILYAQNGRRALAFIALTTASTWLGALWMDHLAEAGKRKLAAEKGSLSAEEKKARKKRIRSRQRMIFWAVLALNVGILAMVKYLPDSAAARLPFSLIVPMGISFYTFQSVGYLIDVYQGKIRAERNPARYALFVSFFPQLIQGPIGRYDALKPELMTPHRLEAENIRRGLMLMLWGFFKKKVIADRAAAMVETVFAQPSAYGGAVITAAVLMYSLQQYADFSGGIDLVTGGAELMGIHLAPNFKRPYFAVSLGDFWRRWHISLGAWMRDYVFYPFALCKPIARLSKAAKKRFGTNFGRALPAALGNVLVFLLVGVWHGATSNYVAWGLYNGLILAASALAEPIWKRFGERHPQLVESGGFHVFRILRTFWIVNVGWFFDRSAHVGDALVMLGRTITKPMVAELADGTLFTLGVTGADYAILAAAALILFAVSVVGERGADVRSRVMAQPLVKRWLLLYGLLFFTMLFYVPNSMASFMYAAF